MKLTSKISGLAALVVLAAALPALAEQKKLFVGNLPWSADDATLRELFQPHGKVISVTIITDRDSGRSRGFGYVEIDAADIQAVIDATNGKEIGGQPIRVTLDEPKRPASRPARERPSERQ